MNLVKYIWLRAFQNACLQFLGAITIVFEYWKAAVDDRVQQRIRQKTCIVTAQARAFRFDALANGVPHFAAGFLEGQNRIVAEKVRELLVLQTPVLEVQHSSNDE